MCFFYYFAQKRGVFGIKNTCFRVIFVQIHTFAIFISREGVKKAARGV